MMKAVLSAAFLLLILTSFASAQTERRISISEEIIQSAVDQQVTEQLEQQNICGNLICQPGEQLSCPQDCPQDLGDLACAFEGRPCTTSTIMIYLLAVGILFIAYQNRGRRV